MGSTAGVAWSSSGATVPANLGPAEGAAARASLGCAVAAGTSRLGLTGSGKTSTDRTGKTGKSR